MTDLWRLKMSSEEIHAADLIGIDRGDHVEIIKSRFGGTGKVDHTEWRGLVQIVPRSRLVSADEVR